MGLDERQGGQLADLAGFQLGLEAEVVFVEGFVVRQLRQAQPGAEATVGADGEFFLQCRGAVALCLRQIRATAKRRSAMLVPWRTTT